MHRNHGKNVTYPHGLSFHAPHVETFLSIFLEQPVQAV